MLVDGAGDRDVLHERNVSQTRKDRIELRAGRTVALDPLVVLFKRDLRSQPKRLVLGELGAKISGQRQHALGVNIAAHLRLTLNVDDTAAPHVRHRRDPRGTAECVAAELDDRQAVDLPDHGTGRPDQDLFLQDHLLNLFLDPVGTIAALPDRLIDMRRIHELGAIRACQCDRFVDNLAHLVEAGRQLVLMPGQPGSIFNDPGQSGLIQVLQVFTPAKRADE